MRGSKAGKLAMGWGLAAAAMFWAGTAPGEISVTNVTAVQRYPWNGLVDVRCTVTGIERENHRYRLSLEAVDPDSGSVFPVSHFRFVRDGKEEDGLVVDADGEYGLLWNARTDLGAARNSNMIVRVTCAPLGKNQLWKGGPYWASENVGAKDPWEYGQYFRWGDTVGFKRQDGEWVADDGSAAGSPFAPGTAPACGKDMASLRSGGWITEDNVLAPEHDAAQALWGGGWRMPTRRELYDLCYNCDWSRARRNGVAGHVVRGRGDYASASIFLPAGGYGNGDSRRSSGEYGHYWSSVPRPDGLLANGLDCYSGYRYPYEFGRHYGFSVRPVLDCPEGAEDAGKRGFAEEDAWTARSGDSAPFPLDTTVGVRFARETEAIAYSTEWNHGGKAQVAADHTLLAEADAPASGHVAWNAAEAGPGLHTLWLKSGGEILTAEFRVPETNMVLHAGPVAENETWEAGKIHVVDWTVTVGNDAVLTIENGAVVKFMDDTVLNVAYKGKCVANGVVFTHASDDTVGGDLRRDGDASLPKADDYYVVGTVAADETTQWRWRSVDGRVLIPEGTTRIGDQALAGCGGVEVAVIPAGVTNIGKAAFYGCAGLRSVAIPDTVASIGEGAFYGCCELGAVTIPAGVEDIGKETFSGCRSLKSMVIPDTVTSIGDEAFYGCHGLEEVIIPASVTNIGRKAFSGCWGLKSIVVPDTVASIGEDAFADCDGLDEEDIPGRAAKHGK